MWSEGIRSNLGGQNKNVRKRQYKREDGKNGTRRVHQRMGEKREEKRIKERGGGKV